MSNDLKYKITADSTDFEKTMARVLNTTETVSNGIGVGIAAGSAAVAASAVVITDAMVQASESAKELENLAILSDMTVESFQNYAFAAERAGISSEKFGDINKDISDKLGDFVATGAGPFKDFFENIGDKVGLTSEELQTLSGPDVLIAVKDAMDEANISAEEQVFYLESLANDAALLNPLLEDSGAAFKESAARSTELGLALTSIEVANLVDVQHSTQELQGAFESLVNHTMAQLAPAFVAVTGDMMDGLVETTGGVDDLAASISDKLIAGLGYAAEGVGFFIKAVQGWQLIVDGMSLMWNSSMSAISSATAEVIDFFDKGWAAAIYSGQDLWLDFEYAALIAYDNINEGFADIVEGISDKLDSLSFTIPNPFGDDWVISANAATGALDNIAETARNASTATEDYQAAKAKLREEYKAEVASGNRVAENLRGVSALYAAAGDEAYAGMQKTSKAIATVDNAIDLLKTTTENAADSFSTFGDTAEKTNRKIVESDNQTATQRNANLAAAVTANANAASEYVDLWISADQERLEARERAQAAEETAINAQLALEDDLTDRLKKLTLDELEYKKDALDQEVEKMLEVAGADKELQQQVADYRKLKLDEINQHNTDITGLMAQGWTEFTATTKDDFKTNLSDYLKGDLGDLGNLWSSTMDSMLSKAIETFADVTVNWATNNKMWTTGLNATLEAMASAWDSSDVGSMFEGWNIFHSGAWNLRDDEVPSILQQGEMVIPKEHASMIRDNLADFSPGTEFEQLAAASAFFSSDSITSASVFDDAFSESMSARFGKNVAGNLAKAISYGDPSLLISSLVNPANYIGMISGSLSEAGIQAMGLDSNTGIWGSKLGAVLGTALSVGSFGAMTPAVGAVAGLMGGYLGDGIGDAFDARNYESARDYLEDNGYTKSQISSMVDDMDLAVSHGLYDPEDFDVKEGQVSKALSAAMAGVESEAAEVKAAIETAKQAAIDAAIDKELEDFFWDIDNKAFGTSHSPVTGESISFGTIDPEDHSSDEGGGWGESTGGGVSSPGGMGYDDAGYRSGGVVNSLIVPQGDDGLAGLKFGEGVIDTDTMDILSSSIRSGSFGDSNGVVSAIKELKEELRQMSYYVTKNTKDTARLLTKIHDIGVGVRL